MNLRKVGLWLLIIPVVFAAFAQSRSKMLVSQSAGHVISRTTSKAPDGSALYSTSMVGTTKIYHWDAIVPLASVFLVGFICLLLSAKRRRQEVLAREGVGSTRRR